MTNPFILIYITRIKNPIVIEKKHPYQQSQAKQNPRNTNEMKGVLIENQFSTLCKQTLKAHNRPLPMNMRAMTYTFLSKIKIM